MRTLNLSVVSLLLTSLLGGCDQPPLPDDRTERGPVGGKADQILGPCDDGSLPVCTIAEPECGEGEILAARNGCVACVDAETCEPVAPEPDPDLSCVDGCGEQAVGGCWCDEACAEYGDCCADYEPACVGDKQPNCDDGTEAVCLIAPPDCPDGTIVAVHGGCFTCADAQTCEPLGLPLNCDDGTLPVCEITEPDCGPGDVLAYRNGCMECVNAFTCE